VCGCRVPQTKKTGILHSLVTDPANRTIWMCSDKNLFQVTTKDEDRDVWRLYLEEAYASEGRQVTSRFETALQHCKLPEQRDQVLTAQADHLFSNGDRELAARKYSKTSRSFEEVALKFVNADDRAALKIFLRLKLESLPQTVRCSSIVGWAELPCTCVLFVSLRGRCLYRP